MANSADLANNADHDQTAPFRSSLIWVRTVCTDLSALILRNFIELSKSKVLEQNCLIKINNRS